jgi:RNA polymerase sigma factor (sigma-70 family)
MAPVRVLLTREQQALAASAAHLPPARADALSRRFRADHLRDDMEGAGGEGLTRGAQKFSPTEGISFPAYAAACIDHAIFRFLRKEGRALKLRASVSVVAAWGGGLVVPRSSDEMDAGEDDDRIAAEKLAAYVDDKALSAALSLTVERESAESSAERSLLMQELSAAMHNQLRAWPERDQRLFVAIYSKGLTVEDAAKEVGIAYPTAKGRHRRLLARLRQALERRGFEWVDSPGSPESDD